MSITDELRRVAANTECANGRCEKLYRGDLDHIADRIDEKVADMQAFCDRLRKAAEGRDDVTLWCVDYVALPVDADGECIHFGDVVCWLDEDTPNKVDCMHLCGDGWWVYAHGVGVRSKELRHYHAPTVEDLIRDAILSCIGHSPECWDKPIAECAAKLRLAGDAE